MKNFVFTHERFADPDVIFQKDTIGHVSLMDVTETHVCFCVTNFDIHDILRYSLNSMNCYHNLKHNYQIVTYDSSKNGYKIVDLDLIRWRRRS